MDYYGFGKAGYYYTRRVYAPVLASFKALENGSVELWITNDTLRPLVERIQLRRGVFATGAISDEMVDVSVPANASQAVWRGAGAQADAYVSVRSSTGSFPTNRHFFAAIKDLQRTPAAPQVTVSALSAHELRVRVQAPAYVYFFHIMSPDPRTSYSDNYIDVESGGAVEIVVRNQSMALTPETLTFGWR